MGLLAHWSFDVGFSAALVVNSWEFNPIWFEAEFKEESLVSNCDVQEFSRCTIALQKIIAMIKSDLCSCSTLSISATLCNEV